jgi:hypothetical protein
MAGKVEKLCPLFFCNHIKDGENTEGPFSILGKDFQHFSLIHFIPQPMFLNIHDKLTIGINLFIG